MLHLQHISKRFGLLPVLQDVSLAIAPGSILGLLGENGAGKSTLMNILFGLLRPDSGVIEAQGRPVRIHSPRAAQALGIGMVHQHFKLVPTLTALQNFSLFLPRKQRLLKEQATRYLERLRWKVPLDLRIDDLTVGQQQRIEIMKALLTIQPQDSGSPARHPPTLILDEPTAVLTPPETAELFAAMAALRDAGAAIVFISHKLAEVRHICSRVAILRRGVLVHEGAVADLSPDQIAEKMVGAAIKLPHLQIEDRKSKTENELSAARARPPVLSFENLSTSQLKNLTLSLYPGEILGIAGVDGNGQSHLVQAILNTLPSPGLLSGKILLMGRDATRFSTRQRLDHLAFIAEDRQKEALVLSLSIRDNLLLKDYRSPRFNTLGFLRFKAWNVHARNLIRQFDIRGASPAAPAARLSGGNQQKIVLARELYSSDKPLVLAVNPTRGLDVGATAFTLQTLLDARTRGAGILLIHSDLDELLAVSDRVAVLYNGTLTSTTWPETTKNQIGHLMLGLPA